jgi:hypothetical protein
MRRRLLRLAVRGACLLSLLACVGTAWAWRRSHAVGRGYAGATVAGRRFTLRSEAGRLTLLAPPRAVAGKADALAAAAAARLSNGGVYWWGLVVLEGGAPAVRFPLAECQPPSVVAEMQALGAPALPPLLAALDDPARFAAAHVVLMELTKPPPAPQPRRSPRPDPKSSDLKAHRRGDRVVLTYGVLELGAKTPDRPYGVLFFRARTAPGPDPAQMPAVRAYWHDRLGVEMASAAHAWVACATALPPLAWCLLRLRRAALRRKWASRGGCATCGYALTGNVSGVCPECGTPSTRNACGPRRRLVH